IVIAHGPGVVGRERLHASQVVVAGTGAGAGQQGPLRAVPVLGQGLVGAEAAGAVVADGPDVAGREGGYGPQVVGAGACVGAGDYGPAGAVPVHREREIVVPGVIEAHGPGVV